MSAAWKREPEAATTAASHAAAAAAVDSGKAGGTSGRKGRSRRKGARRLALHLLLIGLSGMMIYPVLWWFGAAFKPLEELSQPGIFPAQPTLDNFIQGWHAITNYTFTHFFLNSFGLTSAVVVLTLLSASLTAFGFARLDFPLRGFWFGLVLLTLMLPSQVLLVPQYVMYSKLGWVNSYLPFLVPSALSVGISGAFFIFLLVQFIRGIPRELDEAAKIDGCGWFAIYARIMLPLLVPALITVSIFCFLWNWEDFLGQMIYIKTIDKFTVVLALKMFVDAQSSAPWGQLFAIALLSVLPGTILFFSAQKYIVEGIATTGIKG